MPTARDPWSAIAALTPARVALGAAGASLPTARWLEFSLAHALARDAVHLPLDTAGVVAALREAGAEGAVVVGSAARDRAEYLLRPDLGRMLSPASAAALEALPRPAPAAGPAATAGRARVAIVVADGLSAGAVHAHAAPLFAALAPRLVAAGFALAPVVVATRARVALGDPVARALGADAVLMLLGERPGMSAPASLGAYLTWRPVAGTTDAMRNCVSNIHPPEGLAIDDAAHRITWLLAAARRLGASGTALKDESDTTALDAGTPSAVLPAPGTAHRV
jgi:ethanolamine ammonia-lyase small subunit